MFTQKPNIPELIGVGDEVKVVLSDGDYAHGTVKSVPTLFKRYMLIFNTEKNLNVFVTDYSAIVLMKKSFVKPYVSISKG